MKNRILIKTLAMMMMVGTLAGTTGLTAFAAEATETKTETTKQALNPTVVAQVFDAEYYAKTNQDVVDVLGNDPAVLLQHYMVAGIYEGRDASATFNADAYLSANGDLASFYGDNLEGAIEHYIQFGINENRIATVSDAVKAGVTVKSVTNPDAVIAAPVAKKGASGVVVSGGGTSSSSSDSNNGASSGLDEVSSDGYMTLYDLDGNPSRVFVGGVTASGEIMRPNGTSVALGEFFDLSESVGAEAGTVTGVYVGSENNYHLEVGIQEGSDTSWADTGHAEFDDSLWD